MTIDERQAVPRMMAYGGDGRWQPFALNLLTFRGPEIADVTAFIARSAELRAGDAQPRLAAEPAQDALAHDLFVRFGLPAELD